MLVSKSFDTKEEWLKERKKYVTASELPILLGCGYGSSSAASLLEVKLSQDNVRQSRAMEYGSHMEPLLVKWASRESGLPILQYQPYTIYYGTGKYAGLIATPDAILGKDWDDPVVLEVKTVTPEGIRLWKDGPRDSAIWQAWAGICVVEATRGLLYAMLGTPETCTLWSMEVNHQFMDLAMEHVRMFLDKLHKRRQQNEAD